MHIKFLARGTGSARAAADYLLGARDATGQLREGVEVLQGDPHRVAAVADALAFEHKYTSGVIAWAPDDTPTDAQIGAVIDAFEQTAWAGLEPDRYAWAAVVHRERDGAPLLSRVRLGDAVMADVIDALSFERTPLGRRYINYRDLGVQQLGSIYERLLEREVVREGGNIVVRPNVFARKDSGSYYTPDDLVDLIVREAVGPLVDSRMDAFAAEASDLASRQVPEDRRMGLLKRLDPAERTLELKVCDPAMGSGHFLVNLVDYLADRVIEAMAEAEALVDGYLSPLVERIDGIRNTIMANAEGRGWTFDPAQLDDRHIIRRMVLKRCVYGVDKNPMAVELTKVSLWLHTFTVGAPLSFLDHHLRCGDSLFGAWVAPAIHRTDETSSLFLRGPLERATRAASPMQIIEGLTDAEIAEAHRSADIFAEVSEMTAPLDAFMSLLHAFD